MPDSKITALTSIGASTDPANDPLVLVDVSDTSMAASGTTKKVTLNQLLGAGGTATLASATITGDLTVRTNKLAVTSTGVGCGVATPLVPLHAETAGTGTTAFSNFVSTFRSQAAGRDATLQFSDGTNQAAISMLSGALSFGTGGSNTRYNIDGTGISTWSVAGSTAMTLNSTGLGVGVTPASGDGSGVFKAAGTGSGATNTRVGLDVREITSGNAAGIWLGAMNSENTGVIGSRTASGNIAFQTFNGSSWGERMRIDYLGNVGVGVTPSAWSAGYKVLDIAGGGGITSLSNGLYLASNGYDNSGWKKKGAGYANLLLNVSGEYRFNTSTVGGGVAGDAITFTQAMTLDASGNLLVGITSGSYNRIKKDSTADAGNAIFELVGASNATSSIHYSVSSYNANAANAASKFGRDGVTLRSINAGGTINASGADYAEYMVKCGDFVLAKGDVAGIDANGKLTNVFADAVSFVVKSTDPSYVGNDKWGVGLEGADLEAARQLVDRIAFAGQVPVNVTGAKAGDYIVPVVNGTGIKGQAVSNPTFEQYQLAVGKVIGIDADGRARIIVKVA